MLTDIASPQQPLQRQSTDRPLASTAGGRSAATPSPLQAAARLAEMAMSFGSYDLDPAAYELRLDGVLVEMEPQVFEVLIYLVHHRDRVVTKEELLDQVWGSRFVSESALTSRIKSLRRAVGDDGRTQGVIKTVHGRGYRFVADVVERADPPGGDRSEEPATGPEPATFVGALPAERTPLFGRSGDVDQVGDALRNHRLVSLLGIGGVGKTRLAVSASRACSDRFPDGVWFVDLVPVGDERGLVLALADAAQLGVGELDATGTQLAAVLGDRRTLFVIDNAEHVSLDVARVLDRLLEQTGGPSFLVTSRVPLGLPDEHRLAVSPLATDEDLGPGPAVDLLVSAAERLGASIDGDDEVAGRICRHLDGLPLAIELAAAQLRHLSPSALADRLDRRFEVLTERIRPGRERHASLQDVLDDTLSTLRDDERTVLSQMAAFPSSFTLDDLLGVAEPTGTATIENVVGDLLDRSVVVRDVDPESRYRLLETVKLFARQRCSPAELAAVGDRHANWCLDSVGVDPTRFVFDFDLADWCFDHHDDLRAATRHLDAQGRHEEAARLTAASALAMHADLGPRAADTLSRLRGHLEVVSDDALLAQLHLTAVMCAMATRSPEGIAHHGQEALAAAERADDPVLRSMASVLLAWSVAFVDPEAAVGLTVSAAALANSAGHDMARDFADGYRALLLGLLRRYDQAEPLARLVVERAPADRRRAYPTHVGLMVVLALSLPAGSEETDRWISAGLARPSDRTSMWANGVLESAVLAAGGHHGPSTAIAGRLARRLRQAGQDPYPDLLLPPAALAYRLGATEQAAQWLRCVRDAGRPTQSFQATIVYRRLVEAVGAPLEPIDAAVERVGEHALAWMADPTSDPGPVLDR